MYVRPNDPFNINFIQISLKSLNLKNTYLDFLELLLVCFKKKKKTKLFTHSKDSMDTFVILFVYYFLY